MATAGRANDRQADVSSFALTGYAHEFQGRCERDIGLTRASAPTATSRSSTVCLTTLAASGCVRGSSALGALTTPAKKGRLRPIQEFT